MRQFEALVILALFVGLSLGSSAAQQPATAGTFTLHKMAKANGTETYAIATKGDQYTLTSHFKFTDRGSPVPLETTFVAHTADMMPVSYVAKGRASRQSAMLDSIAVKGASVQVTRDGKAQTYTAAGPWFVTDGYSPVAMQEQMMRWWLTHGKPAEFTVYPAAAKVTIRPAQALQVHGAMLQGYTVNGLIWGLESLWMDPAQNLMALVSTDAEFDHFEAVREADEDALGQFIAAGAQESLAELKQLSASARTAPAHKLAIVGATLENPSAGEPMKDSVILMQDGVITAAGSRAQVKVPADAQVIDATGKFAVPGLWDMHAHYEQVEWGPIYLAAGVTAVRDCGNEFDFIRTLHTELDRKDDPAIGPHLEFAGVIDGSGPQALGAVLADTPDQAKALVDRYVDVGAKQIKIYSSVKPEVVQAITAEAHARGVTATGHIPDGMTAMEGVDDGMDGINHVVFLMRYFAKPGLGPDGKPSREADPIPDFNGKEAKALIAELLSHHVVVDPTLTVYEAMMNTVPYDQLEPGLAHVPAQLYPALDSPAAPAQWAHARAFRFGLMEKAVQTLWAAGVPIVAGTDQTVPGYSLHRELALYVQAGLTPAQALQTATINAARALGMEKEAGSIDVGKRGDVLLLNADPLANINNTRTVWRTVAAGAVYDPAPLWQSVGFKP